jgi:hypothetical protein
MRIKTAAGFIDREVFLAEAASLDRITRFGEKQKALHTTNLAICQHRSPQKCGCRHLMFELESRRRIFILIGCLCIQPN